ncbi:carbohydrate ABC transporter permease [Clostridium hominis]|nr:sugar ABC transporter permease [Clostridium hominis]MDU2670489.1 sugar ABC transporter permease [Clostridium sp.]
MKAEITPKVDVKKPKKNHMTLKTKQSLTGWLFVSPALIGFSIFTFGSIIYSFYLSLTDYDLMTEPKFIGFANYIKAFTKDEYFYKYFGNTLYFVVFLVPIVLVISLLLALLINKKAGKLTKAYRVALFLPSITSTIAVSMVWLWIFNPDIGLINNFLTAIGFNNPPMWLNSADSSKMALIIMRVWQMSGYYMIMFLAGLQTIPESLYESAEVDGATGIQRFFKITVPMLSNTTFVVIILLVIEAFNMFESIFIMTSGGPLGSTSTIMYYIYEEGFRNYNMGYASAIAWIFFAVIMVITLIQYRFRNEQGGE